MGKTLITFLGVTFAALSWVSLAAATLPDLGESWFQERVGRSPKNVEVADPVFQYTLRGVLRYQGEPVVNYPAADIVLEIESPCQNPVVVHPDANSNALGEIFWGPEKLDQGGGSCAGFGVAKIRLLSIGVFKIYSQVTSPDENGDGLVALVDLGAFQQSFVTQTNPEFGDLNLDEVINLADLAFFQRHFTAN